MHDALLLCRCDAWRWPQNHTMQFDVSTVLRVVCKLVKTHQKPILCIFYWIQIRDYDGCDRVSVTLRQRQRQTSRSLGVVNAAHTPHFVATPIFAFCMQNTFDTRHNICVMAFCHTHANWSTVQYGHLPIMLDTSRNSVSGQPYVRLKLKTFAFHYLFQSIYEGFFFPAANLASVVDSSSSLHIFFFA